MTNKSDKKYKKPADEWYIDPLKRFCEREVPNLVDTGKPVLSFSPNTPVIPSQNNINGISGDYWNQYVEILTRLESLDPVGVAKLQFIADYFKQNSISSYEEEYQPYSNIVTEKNSKAVKRLDELADKANSFTDPSKFSEKEFETLINEVFKIVCPWEKESYFSKHDNEVFKIVGLWERDPYLLQ